MAYIHNCPCFLYNVLGGWSMAWYRLCHAGWAWLPSTIWLWIFMVLFLSATPLSLAGFFYSSKLAILSHSSFNRKLQLFIKLFTCHRIFAKSWLFYLLRQVVEIVFVLLLPAFILMTISLPWLRILTAGILATPIYSFLIMVSFKFFLYIYSPYSEVKKEYADYYQRSEISHFMENWMKNPTLPYLKTLRSSLFSLSWTEHFF